jgi:hypothetical protein
MTLMCTTISARDRRVIFLEPFYGKVIPVGTDDLDAWGGFPRSNHKTVFHWFGIRPDRIVRSRLRIGQTFPSLPIIPNTHDGSDSGFFIIAGKGEINGWGKQSGPMERESGREILEDPTPAPRRCANRTRKEIRA